MAAAMAGTSLISGKLAEAATLSLSPEVATPATVYPAPSSTDLQLVVNVATGDVSLTNSAAQQTLFTGYNIKVIDGTINTLLVGNPADVGKGTGAQGLPPYTRAAPYTKELLLTEYKPNSPNYNTSAAALGNNPFAWQVAQDGYNTQTSAFGLAESYLKPGTSDAITIPIGGSVDLGTIFNTLASHTDLQFSWSPATSTGANYQGNPFTGIVDYVGGTVTPEPGTLGILGLGGVMMMRRRRRSAGNRPASGAANA
jgi:hypothetical protein